MSSPPVRYAEAGDVSVAYQVVGEGPIDIVLVPGFATHLELGWESPPYAQFMNGLASFSRLIVFDKRGTGLSDPVTDVPTLEQRAEDVLAVMDSAGSERATVLGISEGGPMGIVFAATHPGRVETLVLYGAMARSTEAPDYPWAAPAAALREATDEFIAPVWGRNPEQMLEIFAPSMPRDEATIEYLARFERSSASPAMISQIAEMFLDIDVRDILPAVHVPTLVLHRRYDRAVNRRAGEWMARQMPDARYVELPGDDHLPWAGDQDAVLGEIEEFLTGKRSLREPDRVLSTVMFTDVVGSTQKAAELGDAHWSATLDALQSAMRRSIDRFRGREVKTLGDGMLITFDGPARAIRCGEQFATDARRLDLELHTGIHTGEIELQGDDVGGIAVHIASRIGDAAGPGEVLVSSTVKDLSAGSGVEFEDRGEHELKGVPDRRRLYAVAR